MPLTPTQSDKYAPRATEEIVGTSIIASLADLEARTTYDSDTGGRLVMPADLFMTFTDDAIGNTSAAVGRIPIKIGATTKYIRYYND